MASSTGSLFLDHFAALRDPRQSCKVVYPLSEVLLTVLSGTIAGAEDFVEIRRWALLHMDFLRRFLPFASGMPSHYTLNDIMNAIDAELFSTCFTQWVSSLGESATSAETGPEVVAVDGKTSRRTHDRAQDRNPLHLVSAWASGQRLVLGQQACAAKSNEITAIPLLLERLAIQGALVTIDAMACQTKTAQAIIDRQADYLLAVKDNWPNLHAEIARAFDDPAIPRLPVHDTTDGEHGRIEQRRHVVIHDVAFLNTDRRFPGEPRFPGLKAVAMVETRVERNGKLCHERRFYISSLSLDAELFARAVREHWQIENRLHWTLDVVFHEDLSRLRSGNGPQNMATVRHVALNLLHDVNDKHSLKVRRKSAAWDDAYLEAIIRKAAKKSSSDRPGSPAGSRIIRAPRH